LSVVRQQDLLVLQGRYFLFCIFCLAKDAEQKIAEKLPGRPVGVSVEIIWH
jgi:hypothetical protein